MTLFRFPHFPSDLQSYTGLSDPVFRKTIPHSEVTPMGTEDECPTSHTTTSDFPWQIRASKPPIVSLSTEANQSHSMGLRSALLNYFTAISVLPPLSNGSYLPGKGQMVIYLDSNERFSARRLSRVLEGITSKYLKLDDPSGSGLETLQALTHNALKHVHIQRPQSSRQLIATLRSLSSRLLCKNEHKSFERSVGLIILDSADAFYWQDRLESEHMTVQQAFLIENEGESRPLRQKPDPISQSRKYLRSFPRDTAAETVRLLRQLQKKFDCTILFTSEIAHTNRSYLGSVNEKQQDLQALRIQPDAAHVSYPSTNPWYTFPTMPLIITPSHPVPQFPSTASIQHCLRVRDSREAARSGIKYTIRVDWTGSYDWGPLLKSQIQEHERSGSGQAIMSFGDDGMIVE